MTKEEAIKILKELPNSILGVVLPFDTDFDYTQALDMAIKALEQEPCEDKLAIERYQDLVEYFGDKEIAKTILGDREEFKKWLDRIKWHVRKVDELARKQEQKSCDDCISRKAMLEYQQYLHGKMSNEENHKLWEFIKALPSVTPTQEWIPCSERLPEETGLYLITFKAYGGGYAVTLLYYEKPKKYWTRENIYQFGNDEVLAWMPLPKPYKAEMESEDGNQRIQTT